MSLVLGLESRSIPFRLLFFHFGLLENSSRALNYLTLELAFRDSHISRPVIRAGQPRHTDHTIRFGTNDPHLCANVEPDSVAFLNQNVNAVGSDASDPHPRLCAMGSARPAART